MIAKGIHICGARVIRAFLSPVIPANAGIQRVNSGAKRR
jgi:hypothetical protein